MPGGSPASAPGICSTASSTSALIGEVAISNSPRDPTRSTVAGGTRPCAPPGFRLLHLLVQLDRGPVPSVGGLVDELPVVDPRRREYQVALVAEDQLIGLLRGVVVKRLPILGCGLQLARRDRVELGDRVLDLGVVHLAEVLVVDLLDRVLIKQEVEVG